MASILTRLYSLLAFMSQKKWPSVFGWPQATRANNEGTI